MLRVGRRSRAADAAGGVAGARLLGLELAVLNVLVVVLTVLGPPPPPPFAGPGQAGPALTKESASRSRTKVSLLAARFDTYPDAEVRVSAPTTTPPAYRTATMVVPIPTSPPGTEVAPAEAQAAARAAASGSAPKRPRIVVGLRFGVGRMGAWAETGPCVGRGGR